LFFRGYMFASTFTYDRDRATDFLLAVTTRF
jgi:hypothetical protein